MVTEEFSFTVSDSLLSFVGTYFLGLMLPFIQALRSKDKSAAIMAISGPNILACEHPLSFQMAIGMAFALNGFLALLIVLLFSTGQYNVGFYVFCIGSGVVTGSLSLVFITRRLLPAMNKSK